MKSTITLNIFNVFLNCIAQLSVTDSLKIELEKNVKNDTVKVDILNELVYAIRKDEVRKY